MLKQFVEEQHAIHDAEAKEAVRKFWVELGYDCIENLDEFGVDLLVDDKGREFGCEVETKTGCHGPEFNYPSLRIPFRKKKFTKDRVTFFVLNSGRTHAAVVSRQKLLKSPAVQVKNKMVRWVITSTKLIRRTLSLSIYLLELITDLRGLCMQNYNFLNRSSGEIFTQKFKNLQQVEDFLRGNEQFELEEEDLQNLPIRRTRQIS